MYYVKYVLYMKKVELNIRLYFINDEIDVI